MSQSGRMLPKYQQIAGSLRTLILEGELAAGDEIPSERELAEAWQVARPTVARAVGELRRWGLIESRQGAGTFVSAREHAADTDAPAKAPRPARGQGARPPSSTGSRGK